MLSHYLLVSFRNLRKHKVFSAVNILGLATAMVAALVIFIHVHYETHYDDFWPDAENVHRVVHDRYQNGELSDQNAKAFWGMGQVLEERIPEVVGAAEIFRDVASVSNGDRQIKDISMFGAESTFFDVFPLTFVDKKGDNPMAHLHGSILSESAAIKLFGTANAVGQWFVVNEGWEFEVTGVFKDLPPNTHMDFDLLLTRQTYRWYAANREGPTKRAEPEDAIAYRAAKKVTAWNLGSNGNYLYLRLRPGSSPEKVTRLINEMKAEYLTRVTRDGTRIEFSTQPLRNIHLHSNRALESGPNGDYRSVVAVSLLGAVIMIIAWINFVNLTLARSLERAKEVAVRKVTGASRGQLMVQHLIEYGVINLLSAALAVALLFIGKPLVWQLLDRKIDLAALLSQPGVLLAAGTVLLTGTLLSGFYPALVQSSRNTMLLFKPNHKISRSRLDPRKLLVICQFTASIILIVGVITIFRQIDFMRNQSLGVNIERTLVTYSSMADIGSPNRISALETYKARVRALPGVTGMATASALPGKEILWQRQDIRKASDLPNTKRSYSYAYVDHDFLPTFGLTLLGGRNFSNRTDSEADSLIINETAARQLGFADAESAADSFVWVGENQFKIVGVVNDYHQESLQNEIRPTVFFCGYQWMYRVGYYAITLNSTDLTTTLADIRNLWEQTYPQDDFAYRFLDEVFDQQYRDDLRFGTLFTLFTLIAIFVACLGLQGLATFAIERRTKEIGIRKVNGATPTQIIVMLTGDFARLVAVAFLLACPVAYLVMEKWLQNYAYRIDQSGLVFVTAGGLALLIAVGTTFFQAYRSATRNPITALRYE